MNAPVGDRNLKRLVGDVGASYRQRMLPPGGLVALAVAACAVWTHASPDLLTALTASLFLLTGCVVNWPQRRRLMLPGWRTAGFLGSLYLGLGGTSSASGLVQLVLVLGGLAALIDMALYLARTLGEAEQLNQRVAGMDEQTLLALLPEEAHADASRWLAGDDSKAAELALVLHLSVLWKALGSLQQTGQHEHRTHGALTP